MTSVLNEPYFQNEKAAFDELERIVWPDGPVCPFCGNMGRIYKLEGVRTKPSKSHPEGIIRHSLRKCGECRRQFTVRKGTLFEDSPVPLHLWFQAAYLLCSSKKGISSNQLHRTLGVTLQTAWFMGHRLREAMRTGDLDRALAIEEECDGSVDGMLEQINIHLGANTFHIYPAIGPKKVTCYFPARLYDDAVAAVGKRVEVFGTLRYRTGSDFAHQITAKSIDEFAPEYELPDWDDLRGRAPQATGHLSSEDFVREMRDAW